MLEGLHISQDSTGAEGELMMTCRCFHICRPRMLDTITFLIPSMPPYSERRNLVSNRNKCDYFDCPFKKNVFINHGSPALQRMNTISEQNQPRSKKNLPPQECCWRSPCLNVIYNIQLIPPKKE